MAGLREQIDQSDPFHAIAAPSKPCKSRANVGGSQLMTWMRGGAMHQLGDRFFAQPGARRVGQDEVGPAAVESDVPATLVTASTTVRCSV